MHLFLPSPKHQAIAYTNAAMIEIESQTEETLDIWF